MRRERDSIRRASLRRTSRGRKASIGRAERDAYLRAFAQRLRALREERGLSQTELHKRADLHRSEIGRIENAETEPRLLTLHILAHSLNITIDELIRGLPVPKERRPPPTSRRSA